MRCYPVFLFLMLALVPWPAAAAPVTQDATVEGKLITVFLTPHGSGTLEELTLKSSGHDFAAGDGLLLEGFGVPSAYVPGRRLNESLEIVDAITDRPVLKYSYDCDGPNIAGLHVERVIEPSLDDASVTVRWTLENRGTEQHWVAPWIRNETAPGGKFDAADRIDVPGLGGVMHVTDSAYHPAARNWIAATDTQTKESICLVFDANLVHSFLADYDPENTFCGMQTAFVPRIMKPGDKVQTAYRVHIVRGLSHIDFATDELAAQLDYKNGLLELRLAAPMNLPAMVLEARVARGDDVWKLPAKRFQLNPNQVVRCSYDWDAPADGAYEFYGRVTVNNKEYPLGKLTHSPSGLIDTQFVAGNTRATDLEPWTDAPFALQRGPRTISRDLAAFSGGLAVWFESPLEKVFREDKLQPTGSKQAAYRIALAANERESFQVVLRSDKPLRDVTVRAGSLESSDGSSIPVANVTVHNVHYLPVRTPSYFEGPTGDWPDALPPQTPITISKGQCTPFWVTIHAPANTPPGTYRGMIEIESRDSEPIEVGVDATVYAFALPTQPSLKTHFGFWPDAAVDQAKTQGCRLPANDLFEAYAANAFAHRVTLAPLASLPDATSNYGQSLAAFEPRAKSRFAEGASVLAVPPSLFDKPEALRLANAFVVKNKLQKRTIALIANEPIPAVWERVYAQLQVFKTNAPDIPAMITTFGVQPFLPEELPVWGVHLPMLDTANNVPILQRASSGGEVWFYVNHAPPRPYGNFFVDFAAIEHRILFWHAWALGFAGMYYESVNAAPPNANPYDSLLDLTPANGNAFLIYPSPGGPVSSIRWETIRDGIEDHDYLALLAGLIQRGKEQGISAELLRKAESARNLQRIIPDLVGFTREPAALMSKRAELAAAIEELSRAVQP